MKCPQLDDCQIVGDPPFSWPLRDPATPQPLIKASWHIWGSRTHWTAFTLPSEARESNEGKGSEREGLPLRPSRQLQDAAGMYGRCQLPTHSCWMLFEKGRQEEHMPIRIIHLFALQLFLCCSLCSTEQVVDHCWALSNFLCAASEAGIHELPTWQSGHIYLCPFRSQPSCCVDAGWPYPHLPGWRVGPGDCGVGGRRKDGCVQRQLFKAGRRCTGPNQEGRVNRLVDLMMASWYPVLGISFPWAHFAHKWQTCFRPFVDFLHDLFLASCWLFLWEFVFKLLHKALLSYAPKLVWDQHEIEGLKPHSWMSFSLLIELLEKVLSFMFWFRRSFFWCNQNTHTHTHRFW